jgi:hypothetical protein
MRRTGRVVVIVMAMAAITDCASVAPPPDPSFEAPRVGCRADSFGKSGPNGGKLLPVIVRIIGVTPAEDGERWKVLLPGEFDPENWVPMAKEEIRFVMCGPEAEGYSAASRHAPVSSAQPAPR